MVVHRERLPLSLSLGVCVCVCVCACVCEGVNVCRVDVRTIHQQRQQQHGLSLSLFPAPLYRCYLDRHLSLMSSFTEPAWEVPSYIYKYIYVYVYLYVYSTSKLTHRAKSISGSKVFIENDAETNCWASALLEAASLKISMSIMLVII